MSLCLLSQSQLENPTVGQGKRFTAQIHKHNTADPELFFLFCFYFSTSPEVPTPAIAVEGDGMSFDRFGKCSVYFCLVDLVAPLQSDNVKLFVTFRKCGLHKWTSAARR